MSYTLSGVASAAASSANPAITTVTLSVGPTLSPFVVVAVVAQGGTLAGSTLKVGSISLNLDVTDSSNTFAIFSGVATGLSGSQTLTFSAPGGAFDTNGFCLWYMPTPISKTNTGSAGGAVSSFTIPVNNGDFLFAVGGRGTAFNFNSSTVAPFENTAITGSVSNGLTADWTIAASNASFSVSAGANFNGAGATYTPSAAPAFITIGIGGSEW